MVLWPRRRHRAINHFRKVYFWIYLLYGFVFICNQGPSFCALILPQWSWYIVREFDLLDNSILSIPPLICSWFASLSSWMSVSVAPTTSSVLSRAHVDSFRFAYLLITLWPARLRQHRIKVVKDSVLANKVNSNNASQFESILPGRPFNLHLLRCRKGVSMAFQQQHCCWLATLSRRSIDLPVITERSKYYETKPEC